MRERGWDVSAFIFCALLILWLFSNLSGGAFISDEVTYLLTVDSLYKTGWLDLWNGNNETIASEMVPASSKYVESGGVYGIIGMPAPFYAFMSLPFYPLFGLKSIIALN
ncbi:MAG: hypothetical protein GF334_06090, partial [Candidatus Altiarchaeales archaeon]|nr:hypothetical protein [Candidatus Altiarchaeales archaeon]